MKLIRTKVEGMDLWYREDDRVIGQRIALDKYEKYETALMMSQIGKNDVMVDVGANIGYYTMLLAKRAKKVYALEPDKEIFAILKKNVEANNLKNVVLLNCAASDKKETKYLVKDKENFGNSRLSDKKGEMVNCLRLDDILVNEQKISAIKIDVQGWEPAVIEGAKKVIERDYPTLFLEYTPSEYRDKKMINFLQKIYKNIWSINDFAEVPWPIFKGVKILGKAGYADLFLKNKIEIKDYSMMLKKVNYKKFIKGIMNSIWQK
jgi:FkbM family methyltransferase